MKPVNVRSQKLDQGKALARRQAEAGRVREVAPVGEISDAIALYHAAALRLADRAMRTEAS